MRRLFALLVFLFAFLTVTLAQSDFWQQLPQLHGGLSVTENGTLYVLGSKLSRSTDQGLSWDSLPLPPAWEYYSLYADTLGRMFLGADNKLFTSTDAGSTWTGLPLPSPDIAEVTAFAIDGHGIYFLGVHGGGGSGSGNGTLYVSTDRGTTWILVKNVSRWLKLWSGADRFIRQMQKAPSGEIYMGTNYGGAQSSHERSPWAKFLGLPRAHTTVFGQSDDNELVAVSRSYKLGSGGTLYRSLDAGFRWRKINRTEIGNGGVLTVLRANGNYFAGTEYGAFLSTDNGASWTLENGGFTSSRIPVEQLVRSGDYVIAQAAGDIFRTVSPVPPAAHPVASNQREEELPLRCELDQNFPNPFNPTTTISFQLQQDGLVTIKVYDLLGHTVATLAEDSPFAEGANEAFFDGSGISSGLYYYTMTVRSPETHQTSFSATRKMLLLR